MVSSATNQDPDYDRTTDLHAFDDTKSGVKGLADAGTTRLPHIFIHPPQTLQDIKNPTETHSDLFPVIDLDGIDGSERGEIVAGVREASEKWGFFQVINHGITESVLEEVLDGVRRFNEQEIEIKKQYYTRDYSRKVVFNCNFDLFVSPAANWRDTLYCTVTPDPPPPEEIPGVCR